MQCIKHESANWGHYIIYVSYWRRDRDFTWSSEPCEGPAACRAKAVPSFLSYFKTVSIGPAPEIEPATSRSAVKHSTDLANPAVVYDSNNAQMTVIDHPFFNSFQFNNVLEGLVLIAQANGPACLLI